MIRNFLSAAFAIVALLAVPAAAQQITTMPQANLPLSGAEMTYIIQNGASKQATVGNIASVIGGQFLPIGGGTLTGRLTTPGLTVSGTNTTVLGGTLAVTGATTLAGGTFSGTFSGAHTYSGALTLSAAGTALNVTNNATIGGALGVTGALTGTSETLTGNLTGTTATFSGFLTEGGNTVVNPAFILNGNGTGQLGLRFLVGGVTRWRAIVADAETGNNTGSDFILQSFPDSGASSTNLLQITRSTGLFQYSNSMLVHQTTNDNSSPQLPMFGLVGWQTVSGGGRNATRMGGKFQIDNIGYVINADPAWVTGHSYSIGDIANVAGALIKATSAGVSGAITPTCSGVAPTCSDGTVSWLFIGNFGNAYQMVGGFAGANIASSYGGSPGAPTGVVFGFNTQANSSVPNTVGVVGYELNYGTVFPSVSRVGLQIIGGILGVSQGVDTDVALRIGSQGDPITGGAAPLKHIIDIGANTEATLLDPNGYVLRVYAGNWSSSPPTPQMMTGAGGIDFSEFQATGTGTFGSGFIFRGPGSQILQSGDLQSNYALLHQTATGASLDASQYHVTSAALHAGGGGGDWAAAGWLANCADGTIIRTTAGTSGTITAIVLVQGSYNSAPPTNPVACTSESVIGNSDGANNARLPATTLQVDMTAVQANGGSPVLALGGAALVTAATAAPGTNTTQLATTAFSSAAVAVETTRATTAEGLLAPKASPTFTGTVTIPAGASISGFAPLASPTFTGTVTIPAGASISGFAPLASPTFTGTLNAATANFAGSVGVGNNTTTQTLTVNGPAGIGRVLIWATANVKRWQAFATATAEGGANAGSDFAITAYDDSGTLLSTPILITRSTGLITAGSITVTGTLTSASYKSGAAVGVSCAANSVTLLTEVVTNGIVTHC